MVALSFWLCFSPPRIQFCLLCLPKFWPIRPSSFFIDYSMKTIHKQKALLHHASHFRSEFLHALGFPRVPMLHSGLPCSLPSVSPMFIFQGSLFCSRKLIRSGFDTERPACWMRLMTTTWDNNNKTHGFLINHHTDYIKWPII